LAEITLSKAVRSNLLNLQSTAELMSKTQERLATGLKVNSALDNPTNYFTASSLKARSSDLGNLLDSVSNAIQTVEAADNGITAITKLVQSAQSTARQALQDRSHSTVTTSAADASVGGATSKTGAEAMTLDADLGLSAGDTITFTSTNATTNVAKSFVYTVGAGDTVQDLVTAINVSGAASAAVGSDGRLSLSTDGTKSLTVDVAAADADGDATLDNLATTFLDNLGFTTGVGAGTDWATNGAGTDTNTLTIAAAGTTASTVRADLATQFNDLLAQIDKLAEDSGYNGINLLGGANETLKLIFNEDGSSNIQIKGVDASSAGLGISQVTGDFTDDDDIQTTLDQLSDALSSLRSQSSRFGSNLSVIQTRQDFTKSMINTLETGAANLTLADTNEEAANLLALQTRQQLSSTALSLASQADQQVLRLF
jgi:flagellin-like hook-associated protein FlgL